MSRRVVVLVIRIFRSFLYPVFSTPCRPENWDAHPRGIARGEEMPNALRLMRRLMIAAVAIAWKEDRR